MRATDTLFETIDLDCDPEGLISKYVQYESFRLLRDAQIDDMVGTLQERLGVLLWYLIDYSKHRSNDVTLPLSSAQVNYLNQPAPLANAAPAVSIALLNFVHRELSPTLNFANQVELHKAVFWWCVDFAPRFKLDDRLVTQEQIALLRTEIQWIGEDFPLNLFMVQYFNTHAELHMLDMNLARDRAAYLVYLTLLSFSQPDILKFIPRESLRRILRDRRGGSSVFDKALAQFCRGIDDDDAIATEDAKSLRELGERVLDRNGLSLTIDRPIAPATRDAATGNTGECFLPPQHPIGPIDQGVAVIGPIFKASGLGQAMRLSVDVLTHCEQVRPTVIDFALDNPAPVGFSSVTDHETYRNKRGINLIHLNAESIPLAFAYQPKAVFEDSYNVGYFFWELNEIPKCHRLGLELLDEIWVSSEYNREIYARFTHRPVINVGMAVEPLPDVARLARESLGLDEDVYVFLTTFDSFSFIERKNPLGVLEAFRRAFPSGEEKVRLIVKTQNKHRVQDPYQIRMWKKIDRLVGTDSRIVVINETVQYRDLLALKRACDCYVSLHRAEGWGFGMIEAMQLAMPVIATAYSGNMDFCTAETAYLVDYTLTSVRPEEYIFVERNSHWADPDLEMAARHMRHVAAEPEAARLKGAVAAAFIAENFSLEAIGRRYGKRLAELRAGR